MDFISVYARILAGLTGHVNYFMSPSGQFSLSDSKLFNFIELERVEIAKIRWIESEKLGHDCGAERALWVWTWRYRDAWRKGLRASGLY